VVTVQVVLTLIDYQFNVVAAVAYPDEASRAAFIGEVHAAIDLIALVLQALAGPIFSLSGLPLVLLAIPVCVGLGLSCVAWLPRAGGAVIALVTGKALDYSLSRAAKEMLYIPLSHAEKTQGKAIADILGYRVAKGAASLLLVWLTAHAFHERVVLWIAIGLVVLWSAIAVLLGRRSRADNGAPLPRAEVRSL